MNLLGGLMLLAASEPMAAKAQWQPSKPVELVLPTDRGGAGEAAARKMIEIINKNNLASIKLSPVFKPKDSASEAFLYFAKADPNHTLMLSTKLFYITPIQKPKLGVDITLYTPIATMGADTLALWLPKERSDIGTLADFVKAVRAKAAKGKTWIMGGTGRESEDRLLTGFLNASYKLNMKYVSFLSGGEAPRQLAAKKVDSAINTAVEQKANVAAGVSKPIVVFGSKRLALFPNTPTLMEAGDKFAHELQRSISGPPAMSMEAQLFYAKLFRKVFVSPEWKAYRKENGLTGRFLSGPGLIEYWQEQIRVRRRMLAVVEVFKGLNAPNPIRVR
jgi:putative tricarboxylic transport membrane protein